jgi:hypothetical protein
MNSHAFSRLTISIVAVLLGFTTFAQAGPPLICHPIEIGQAKSLPWVEFNYRGRTDYDLKNLSRDTRQFSIRTRPFWCEWRPYAGRQSMHAMTHKWRRS